MKQHKNMIKIIIWLSVAVISLFLLIFILASDRTQNPVQFYTTCILIWCAFFLFCLFKLRQTRVLPHVFRKGVMKLHDFDDMNGVSFEELTCDILVANGFELAENTQASADFGVDVIAVKDGMSYAIQCKRYQTPVGIEAVQQVYAGRAYYECHVAVVLSNQYFTSSAIKLADKIGVVLWDRDTLSDFIR